MHVLKNPRLQYLKGIEPPPHSCPVVYSIQCSLQKGEHVLWDSKVFLITHRCVAEEQRTLALGVQSLIFRALGSIPGPIVFGVIFDSTCLFWQFDCDRRGNCWVYDNLQLSNRALALALSGVILNFIFSFLSWLVYPKTKKEKKSVSENPDDQNKGETASVASSDSYTIEGPMSRPMKRTSVMGRMESHCSEDILLDSTDMDHIDAVIPMTKINEVDDHKTWREEGNVEAETALVGNMHDMRARSVGSSSPVQVVPSPP